MSQRAFKDLLKNVMTQQKFICLKSAIEAPEKSAKYV